MKKLLKSEFYRIYEQYTSILFTAEKSKHTSEKKKKKERNANVDPRERILYVKKFALGFFD